MSAYVGSSKNVKDLKDCRDPKGSMVFLQKISGVRLCWELEEPAGPKLELQAPAGGRLELVKSRAAGTGLLLSRRWGCSHLHLLSVRTCSV